jgi:hypothetical protein
MTTKKKEGITIRPYLRIIGDVHGRLGRYVELAKEAEYSIQVGDCNFNYDYLRRTLDPVRHRIIAGNHDNYTEGLPDQFILQSPHFLGDYGIYTVPGFGDIFYLRGGYSIDWQMRMEGIDWWKKEEMDYSKLLEAIEFYKQKKPDFVITHECPKSLIPEFATIKGKEFKPSRTAEALEQMLDFQYHKPKRWIFGHHHQDKIIEVNGTIFQCLAELSYVDFAMKK